MHSWGQERCMATTSLCKWGTTALLLQPPHSQSLSSSHHFPMHPEELERLYRGFLCLLDGIRKVIPSPSIWDHQGPPLEALARRSLKTMTFCLSVSRACENKFIQACFLAWGSQLLSGHYFKANWHHNLPPSFFLFFRTVGKEGHIERLTSHQRNSSKQM